MSQIVRTQRWTAMHVSNGSRLISMESGLEFFVDFAEKNIPSIRYPQYNLRDLCVPPEPFALGANF